MSTIQQFEEAAAKATQASAQADTWANGPEGVFVDTASGPVPTIAEFNREAASRVKGTAEAGTGSLMRVGGKNPASGSITPPPATPVVQKAQAGI